MSNTLHKLNLDMLKIPTARVVEKDGKQFLIIETSQFYMGKGAYLNLDMRENKNGEDQWGNTHMIVIQPTKEQREAKEKTPIIGNAKTLVFGKTSRDEDIPKFGAKAQDETEVDLKDLPF